MPYIVIENTKNNNHLIVNNLLCEYDFFVKKIKNNTTIIFSYDCTI